MIASRSGTPSPDERCSQAILDFLSTTGVGRRVPNPAEGEDQSEASEWAQRTGREGRGEEAGGRGAGSRGRGTHVVLPHSRSVGLGGRAGGRFLLPFPLSLSLISLVRSLGTGQGAGHNEPQGQWTEPRLSVYRHNLGLMRLMKNIVFFKKKWTVHSTQAIVG